MWATGSHASHLDVLKHPARGRHPDTSVSPQMLPSFTYLPTRKLGRFDRETLCAGHRALAHGEPSSPEVPAHTRARSPHRHRAQRSAGTAPRCPGLPSPAAHSGDE